MINSRLANFRCNPDQIGATHLPKLRVACLPSSLSLFLSLALLYSSNPPVLVCGTAYLESNCEPFLVDRNVWNCPKLIKLCITHRLIVSADFPTATIFKLAPHFTKGLHFSYPVNPQLTLRCWRFKTNTGILTCHPSTTPAPIVLQLFAVKEKYYYFS